MNLNPGATTSVTLRSLEAPSALPERATGRVVARPTGRVSRAGKAIGALTVLLIAVMGMVFAGGTSGREASAGYVDNPLCMYDDPGDYEARPQMWPGLAGGLGILNRDFLDVAASGTDLEQNADDVVARYMEPYPDNWNVTAYEWYGTAGQSWPVYHYADLNANCNPVTAHAGGAVANVLFLLGQMAAEVGLTVFGWAMGLDAIGPFLDIIDTVVGSLSDALFGEYLIPVIMLGTLWMAWVGLVKKRTTEAVQGVVWMTLAGAASIFFLTNPTFVIGKLDGVVLGVQYTISQGVLNSVAGVKGTDLCGTKSKADPEGVAWRTAQCQIWETYVFAPWATGMLGPVAAENINVAKAWDDGPSDWSAEEKSSAVKIGSKDPTNNIALVLLDSQAWNHDQYIALKLNTDPNFDRQSEINHKTAQWHTVYDAIEGGDATAAQAMFTGDDWTGRVGIAFVNLVALALGALPLLFLAFTLVLYQLGTVLLVLVAPLFLTLGIHPGFGRKIAMSWLEMLLSVTVKRLGTYLLMVVLLAMFMAVQRSTDAWLAKTIMIGAISIAVMVFRKRFLDSLTRFNLGGGGAMDGNQINQKGKQYARTAGSSIAQGAGAGATAQGGGGKVGAFLGGAVAGAFLGQRSGPMSGATMGWRRGKAQGNRQNRRSSAPGQGENTIDPNNPASYRKAWVAEENAQVEEDHAMDDSHQRNDPVDEQVRRWTAYYKKYGRKVPVPENPDVQRGLEAQGVPLRERWNDREEAYKENARRDKERAAMDDFNRARDEQATRTVEVVKETTNEVRVETEKVKSATDGAVPTRPPVINDDLARDAFNRAGGKRLEEQERLAAEREKAGEGGDTRDVGPQRPPKIQDD